MIYNDTLAKTYGTFGDVTDASSVVASKRNPTSDEYNSGFMNRAFIKKVNENIIIEVDYKSIAVINTALYARVEIAWKISGARNNVIKNGFLDKAGVIEQNKTEIDRIKKEKGIDLSSALPNLLEYWRGF